MRFEKSNTFGHGRPKGARNKTSRLLAAAARKVLDEHFGAAVEKLLDSKDEKVVLETLKWLSDRGYGRPPFAIQTSSHLQIDGLAPDSPQAIVLALAGQPLPRRLTLPAPEEETEETS